MKTFAFVLSVCVLQVCTFVSMETEVRPKRILLEEDTLQSIVSRLDNLTAENTELKQKVAKLEASSAGSTVAFMAYLTSSVTGTAKQNIIYDKVITNEGNAYHASHGNFVTPVNGTYFFSLYACSAINHWIILDLMKNNQSVGKLVSGDDSFNECTTNTFIIHLLQGDDIYVNHIDSGDYLHARADLGWPSFMGTLIGAD